MKMFVRRPKFQIPFALVTAITILIVSGVARELSLLVSSAIAAAYLVANYSLLIWSRD